MTWHGYTAESPQVPKVRQLLAESAARPAPAAARGTRQAAGARRAGTHATDRVSHAVLSALPAPAPDHISTKDQDAKYVHLPIQQPASQPYRRTT